MKKLIIIVIFLLGNYVIAQNNEINAFSESYTNETNKEYQSAIDNMLSLNKETYLINLRLGWLYYLNGEYNKSKVYYEKSIVLKENSIEAKFGLVYPVAAMQNWDEVINIYRAILKIDTQNTTAKYRLAYIYFIRKNWQLAEKYLEEILILFPFDYDSNLLLGSTYIKNGKIKEAKIVLHKALAYNPQSNDVIELLKGL
jgi:tetratricopeptide (TPR) repeat protein